jgi:hypothetical protein
MNASIKLQKTAAPEFCNCGADMYICQVCHKDSCSKDSPSEWRPDITGNESAGNVCPECVKRKLQKTASFDITTQLGKTLRVSPERYVARIAEQVAEEGVGPLTPELLKQALDEDLQEDTPLEDVARFYSEIKHQLFSKRQQKTATVVPMSKETLDTVRSQPHVYGLPDEAKGWDDTQIEEWFYHQVKTAAKDPYVGLTLDLGNARVKVVEYASGYMEGPDRYWVEILNGTFHTLNKGEQFTLTERTLRKYLQGEADRTQNYIDVLQQSASIELQKTAATLGDTLNDASNRDMQNAEQYKQLAEMPIDPQAQVALQEMSDMEGQVAAKGQDVINMLQGQASTKRALEETQELAPGMDHGAYIQAYNYFLKELLDGESFSALIPEMKDKWDMNDEQIAFLRNDIRQRTEQYRMRVDASSRKLRRWLWSSPATCGPPPRTTTRATRCGP